MPLWLSLCPRVWTLSIKEKWARPRKDQNLNFLICSWWQLEEQGVNVRVGFPGKLTWHRSCHWGSFLGGALGINIHGRQNKDTELGKEEALNILQHQKVLGQPCSDLRTWDDPSELSGFGFGACVFRLLCQKLTGYRLFLEWGLTLGQGLFSWVKLSERGYKPRTASQKTFQYLGQKFFSPDGNLGGKKQHLQQKCAAFFTFRHVIDWWP